VVSTNGGVSDDDFAAARGAGLTDAELGDIVAHVAVNVLTNYFNMSFQVDVDFPVVKPHAHQEAA
jgi:alkylhydroperoxidase family enzyme